jgi:heme oxygenase
MEGAALDRSDVDQQIDYWVAGFGLGTAFLFRHAQNVGLGISGSTGWRHNY